MYGSHDTKLSIPAEFCIVDGIKKFHDYLIIFGSMFLKCIFISFFAKVESGQVSKRERYL